MRQMKKLGQFLHAKSRCFDKEFYVPSFLCHTIPARSYCSRPPIKNNLTFYQTIPFIVTPPLYYNLEEASTPSCYYTSNPCKQTGDSSLKVCGFVVTYMYFLSLILSFSRNTVKPLNRGHLRVWSKLSAFRRFGENCQFLSFLPFSLLYQDMQAFSDKKGEKIGSI